MRERKKAAGGKGGVWCHHAALRLRALPGAAATAAAVIYGRRERGGEIPPVAPPLFPSLPPRSRPPQALGAGEQALFSGSGPAGIGVTRPFLWPATATHPSSPRLRQRDGPRDPTLSRFHPSNVPLSSGRQAFCLAEFGGGGDRRLCVHCFSSVLLITIALVGSTGFFH